MNKEHANFLNVSRFYKMTSLNCSPRSHPMVCYICRLCRRLSVCLPACLRDWLSACQPDCLPVCLSFWLSAWLSVCLTCLFLSAGLSLSVWPVPFCRFCLFVSACRCLSVCPCLAACLFLSVSLCQPVYFSRSILSISVCICLCLCMYMSIPVYVCLYLSISIWSYCVCVRLSISVHNCLFVSIFVCLFVVCASVCLFVCLSYVRIYKILLPLVVVGYVYTNYVIFETSLLHKLILLESSSIDRWLSYRKIVLGPKKLLFTWLNF